MKTYSLSCLEALLLILIIILTALGVFRKSWRRNLFWIFICWSNFGRVLNDRIRFLLIFVTTTEIWQPIGYYFVILLVEKGNSDNSRILVSYDFLEIRSCIGNMSETVLGLDCGQRFTLIDPTFLWLEIGGFSHVTQRLNVSPQMLHLFFCFVSSICESEIKHYI